MLSCTQHADIAWDPELTCSGRFLEQITYVFKFVTYTIVSMPAVQFYIPTNNRQALQFSYIFPNSLHLYFFYNSYHNVSEVIISSWDLFVGLLTNYAHTHIYMCILMECEMVL